MDRDKGYCIDVWSVFEDELDRKLCALKDLDYECFMAICSEVSKITGYKEKHGVGINRSDRIETLNGVIDTYVYPIWGCNNGEKFIMTREISTNTYVILGMTKEKVAQELAFELACRAHGLTMPTREKNED
jgi:hypothetical protein